MVRVFLNMAYDTCIEKGNNLLLVKRNGLLQILFLAGSLFYSSNTDSLISKRTTVWPFIASIHWAEKNDKKLWNITLSTNHFPSVAIVNPVYSVTDWGHGSCSVMHKTQYLDLVWSFSKILFKMTRSHSAECKCCIVDGPAVYNVELRILSMLLEKHCWGVVLLLVSALFGFWSQI